MLSTVCQSDRECAPDCGLLKLPAGRMLFLALFGTISDAERAAHQTLMCSVWFTLTHTKEEKVVFPSQWCLLFCTSEKFIVPCEKFRPPYLGQATVATRASLPIPTYQCVQYFCVSKQWYRCKCWGFLTCKDANACSCTQELTNTGGESALKVDSRRNVPCHTGWAVKPPSLLCQAFQSDGPPSSQLSHSILMFAIK